MLVKLTLSAGAISTRNCRRFCRFIQAVNRWRHSSISCRQFSRGLFLRWKPQLGETCHLRRVTTGGWKSKKKLQKEKKQKEKKTGSACRTSECSKTKTARSIVQCCTLRRAMESLTHLRSKPAKDRSLRSVTLCGEFRKPQDGEQVRQAKTKPNTVICEHIHLHAHFQFSVLRSDSWCVRTCR